MAVLEIEIPSGYGLVTSDALDLIASGIHPTLRDTLISPGRTSWYFDYVSLILMYPFQVFFRVRLKKMDPSFQIPVEWTCFNHTVRRWYPVANLSATRQATIYETYAVGEEIEAFPEI